MTRRRMFMACASAFLSVSSVLAHPGHSHKVLGTIAKIEGKQVTVNGTDGKPVTFEVTAKTKLIRDPKIKGVFEELKTGMRAVVTLGDAAQANTAIELRYSEPAATKK